MAQSSVLTPTTLQQDKHTTSTPSWMRHFFTVDLAPANRPVADLQRRACWVALAIILQSANEIDHDFYFPYLGPIASLIPLALFLGSFYALWMAFRPTSVSSQARNVPQQLHPARWQRIVLVLTLLLTIGGTLLLGRTLVLSFSPAQFSNDGTSLDTNAATLLVEGRNPYTDSNLVDILRRFPIQPDWTTPLRVGQFANRLDYPSMAELESVLDTSLKANTLPEFESKVSYPALSFLTLAPFTLFQDFNVLPFYLLCYLALVAIAWKAARPELRPWVLLLALANVPMWASVSGGNLDILNILLIVLAWLLRDQRKSSAICFGLALATKQISWYFIPFYLIMTWRHYGFKESFYRIVLAGSIGLVINLPFILWSPQAWFAGIMAPIADPMFPMGVGVIDLSITHLLPYFSGSVYTILEAGGVLLSLVWYWRVSRQHPEAALLLAVLPLFLAWRSLSSYFYCAAFPLFMLMASRKQFSLRVSFPALLRKADKPLSLSTPISL